MVMIDEETIEVQCEDCGGSGVDSGGLSPYERTDCPACPACFGYGKVFIELAAAAVARKPAAMAQTAAAFSVEVA